MVGRDVLLRVDKTAAQARPSRCSTVEDLHVFDDRGIEKVRGVSFEVRAGEIVGIAGIDGNGQTELIDAMTGLRHVGAGTVVVVGDDVTTDGAHDHFDAGLGHIPEDRQRRGLVLEFSIAENIALHDYRSAPDSRFGWLLPAPSHRARAEADQGVRRARRRTADARRRRSRAATSRRSSSPARSTATRKVLIAAQPTRGLDVGAIEFVHRRLVEERDEGRGVLLVSLELEEILSLSDRILVMYEGEIVGEFPPTATEEQLGVAMTGGGRGEEEAA